RALVWQPAGLTALPPPWFNHPRHGSWIFCFGVVRGREGKEVIPSDRLSGEELKRLRRLIAGARELSQKVRRFADSLPERTGKQPETERTITRSRLECILADRITYAIEDLQDILDAAEKEVTL